MLVNNAGVDRPGSILKADAEGIDLLVDVNLRAVLHLCRLVVPGMVARDRGHVVNISSIAAAYNFGGNSHLPRDQGGGQHAVAPAAHRLLRQAGARDRDLPGPRGDRHLRPRARRLEETRKRFVEGFELPQAADIANAIAFAIAAPVAVNIGHMEITPTLQVPGGLSTAKPETARA